MSELFAVVEAPSARTFLEIAFEMVGRIIRRTRTVVLNPVQVANE